MVDESRSRKIPDHQKAVAFTLAVAEENSRLLWQSATDPELANLIGGFVPNSIRSTVHQALTTCATFVADLAAVSAWDLHARPTPAQEVDRAKAIRAIGLDLTKLAEASVIRAVAFSEFEGIRAKLTDLGFALKPSSIPAVADATFQHQHEQKR